MSERMSESSKRLADDAKDVKDTVQSEIAALRQKVESLMEARVNPALSQVAAHAEDFVHGASEMARRQSGQLASTVRAQPFAAIGTAVIAGLAIGLLMRR